MFDTVRERGILLVVSGPSGVGKGTVIQAHLDKIPELKMSVSVTTRQPRPGEVEGESYYFRDRETFLKLIAQKEILEYDEYCDNYYGTPKAPIMERLNEAEDTVMDVTVPGALRTMEMIPETVSVFLFPPSMNELRERLQGRGTETKEVLEKRLETAKEEIRMAKHFDYILVNDTVEKSRDVLMSILEAEKHRRTRLTSLEEFVANL